MTNLAYLAANTVAYDVIIFLGLTLIVGLFFGKLFEHFNIPSITGYIVVGLGIGFLIRLVDQEAAVETFKIVTSVTIGFIAFSIGMELDFKKLKKRRKEVVVITLTQAIFAALFTTIAMWGFGLELHIALIFGSIAIATEPGPILSITKKYRAHGPLTDTLVPLHGVEDMFAILFFGLTIAYAVAVESQVINVELIARPFLELLFSFAIGIVIGLIFHKIIQVTSYNDPDKDLVVMTTAITAIMIAVAIANRGFYITDVYIHLSPILLPMVVGITFANTSTPKAKHEIEHVTDLLSAPLMIVFFTVIGAEVIILVSDPLPGIGFSRIALYVGVYVIARTIAKLTGSYVGAKWAHSAPVIKKYLGLSLLTQAQAAIGLAFIAQGSLINAPEANLILIVILISTVIYELFAPFALQYAILKSHEADETIQKILYDQHHQPLFKYGLKKKE